MKRLLIAAAAITALTAHAQAPQAAAVASPAAAAPTPEVNPFNNTPLSIEELQKKLRLAQLETQFLEEQLKQASVRGDLQTVPARKAVETAQAQVAEKKERVQLGDLIAQEQAAKAARAEAEKARKEATKPPSKASKGKPSAGDSGASADAPPMPMPVVPTASLVSVLQVGQSRSAVLDFDGNTLVVSDGDMTPQGPLRILGADSATLGSRALKVRGATLSRFVVSDATTPERGAATGAGAPRGTATSAASVQQALAAAVAPKQAPAGGNPGTAASLPALQLPPGVTVLPPPARATSTAK